MLACRDNHRRVWGADLTGVLAKNPTLVSWLLLSPLQKKVFNFLGVFGGKPNLISTKKLKSKDPTQQSRCSNCASAVKSNSCLNWACSKTGQWHQLRHSGWRAPFFLFLRGESTKQDTDAWIFMGKKHTFFLWRVEIEGEPLPKKRRKRADGTSYCGRNPFRKNPENDFPDANEQWFQPWFQSGAGIHPSTVWHSGWRAFSSFARVYQARGKGWNFPRDWTWTII